MRSSAGWVSATAVFVVIAAAAVAGCGGKATGSSTMPPPGGGGGGSGAMTGPTTTEPGGGKSGDAAKPAPAALDKAVCKNRPDMFGPFALDEAQAKARYGVNARTYTDAPTTKDRPIEVCGIPAQRQWLRGTACADGSTGKQNGRVGNVGPGGRCGAIIDLYTVTCPEAEYKVFIDMYMCGPGESF